MSHVMTTKEWWNSTGREYAELAKALVSRPLTVAELQRVGAIGYYLLVPMNVSYNTAEKQREFAALLAMQQLIQVAAAREGPIINENADVSPQALPRGPASMHGLRRTQGEL